MHHAALVEKYALIQEQLQRFNRRVAQVEAGEQIYSQKPGAEEIVEITPNVLARYRNMISICEFAIQLLEEHHLSETEFAQIPSANAQS